MTYYLHHYFDPNFDHTALKPRPLSGGKADLRNLGYVQNVLPGQILAELIPLEYLREENANLDPRFILEKPEFPAGIPGSIPTIPCALRPAPRAMYFMRTAVLP